MPKPFALLAILAIAGAIVAAQAQTFVSGTIVGEDGRGVPDALISAGMFSGASDADGRFSMGAVAGSATLKIAAKGFESLAMDINVPADGPLFGLAIKLRRGSGATKDAEGFSADAVKTIVSRAAQEWGTRHPNILPTLEREVRERWPGTLERPIPVAATAAIDVYVASPYVFYRTGVSEAIRKMDVATDVPYPQGVVIVVNPRQIDAPDIEKVVVERNGQVVEPTQSRLERTVMTSRAGVEVVVHSGFVEYALSTFAAGSAVRVTAIPRSGSNFVAVIDGATLSTMR